MFAVTTESQKVKHQRGRKRGESITGFTSQHGEVIRSFILLYEMGATDKSFKTGMAPLARFIYSKELLFTARDGELIPLKISSIIVEISIEWNEMKRERKAQEIKEKNAHRH